MWSPGKDATTSPITNHLVFGLPANGSNGVFEIERTQRLHCVWVECQSRTDFLQLWRGFVHPGFESALSQGTCGRKTADTAADHGNAGCSAHDYCPPCLWRQKARRLALLLVRGYRGTAERSYPSLDSDTAPFGPGLRSLWQAVVLTVSPLAKKPTSRSLGVSDEGMTKWAAGSRSVTGAGYFEPGVVGIDGGYLRHWEHKQTHFVAIVGKSIPSRGEARCFGFVQSQDTWPRRRLGAILRAQGLRSGPKLAFLSDGEDNIRSLQWHLSPRAQHLLDWFHLAMRLQRLRQFLVGLTHLDPAVGTQMQTALERTKWSLWHGRPKEAFRRFREVEWRIWQFATRYPRFSALARAVNEFLRYIDQNAHIIPDYGARWRAGQVISTAFIESLVNSLLAKRFTKKQSMQWTPESAHLLLQIRTRTLNADLASTFRNSYPDFSIADEPVHQHFLAA